MNERIYRCEVCFGVNHVVRTHCQTCGAMPAAYTGGLMNVRFNDVDQLIEVIPAKGCERQTDRRAHKVYFRTVPADYYATA